jgi:hypothetical protein
MILLMEKKVPNSPQTVILLAGKRKVLPGDEVMIFEFGKRLALEYDKCIFRSGNADGADQYFIEGVKEVAPDRVQLVLPFENHRKKTQVGVYTQSIEQLQLSAESPAVYQANLSANYRRLIDLYFEQPQSKAAIKASYLIRDMVMVFGHGALAPISAAYFYDDLTQPCQGGTGFTMQLCTELKIPFWNQGVWGK